MKITVSDLIVRFLERLGIDVIFGMPGAHILPVYDSLYDSPIESVLVKHEQGAAFMAGGYARASGRIGACITTAGPGATNLVTGIANAYADRLPVLVITGETSTHIFGKGGLQESSGEGGAIDQVALFKGITRYNTIVERSDYLAQVLNQAANILLSPTPGPVLLSLPFNVQQEVVDEEVLDRIRTTPRPHGGRFNGEPLKQLRSLLLAAKHPVIIAGYGCLRAGAEELLQRLSARLSIPVATSLKGKGVYDESSPLSLGTLGVTSDGQAYHYISEGADLLLVLGAGFNERTSYLWDKKLLEGRQIVQVDSDPAQLEKVFSANLAIHGDITEVLTALLDSLDDAPPPPAVHLQRDYSPGDYAVFQSGFALPQRLFARLGEALQPGAMLFDDNMIFAQNFLTLPMGCRYFSNSGISSLGHSIPAAIGARFSADKPTFAILGDGGFQMCCMEIMTAVNYGIPLNIIMFNNSTMGLIRKNQHQQYQQRFINCDFTNPDYGHLARSFGINHICIERNEDIDALFTEHDLEQGINLIEVMLDKNTFPNYSSRR